MHECCGRFATSEKEYALASGKAISEAAERIRNSSDVIDAGLYRAYSDSLRKAVGKVFNDERRHIYCANVSRFAAYKAYQATMAVRGAEDMAHAELALRKFNSYQAAEYNTAVTRCRTAKQWTGFAENAGLFPNIRWLPSRSASPREEHELFYNRIWAKDDPFWDSNQPGNLWNCKCDWEETADPVTGGNPKLQVRHPGLEGNPGKTGEVFSDNASYISKSGKVSLDHATAAAFPSMQPLLDADTGKFRLDFFSDKGGFLQTDRERIRKGTASKQERETYAKEHSMCMTLAAGRHDVVYRDSSQKKGDSYDIVLDGQPADLKKARSANNIVHYAKKAIKQQGASVVVFEFSKITVKVKHEISKLSEKNIHGYYFETGSNKIYEF